ncbi:TIGR03503 family protein [Modicisalibacter muralis]|uniref:TIGR03503 family protein n=1 Tax=Modicisalibacter muralis TaxID=119000 RepID=A0A1G9F672_9GAMM|nr:VWA domain-containing protein [Halomonas muralis]SDK83820.1 TIGR03503 family protein [Halomonas muralis]
MRVLIAATLLSLLAWTTQGWAQETPEDRPDVRMVIDVSGSMKYNDPNRLSASALELMVSLLPSGARSGLWTFGSEVANPLPTSTVDDAWRRRALALKPALFEYQQFTDIEQAVRQAASAPPASSERHLVLLTDGVVDVPAGGGNKSAQDAASRQRLLDELAPALADENVVIHTIAFSPQVDITLLENMARTTGGLAAVAETPEALMRAFLDVFDRIFPRDQLPLEDNRFRVDDRVEAFSSLLFHEPDAPPLVLIGPDGERYTAEDHPEDIRWEHQPLFDLITVPNPSEGEWRIEGEIGDESRVNIDSPLSLRTDELPTALYRGFETQIEAWLEERGVPLAASETPQDLQVRAELRDIDNGDISESVTLASDGDGERLRYRGLLPAPETTGNARLAVIAESDEFVRQRRQAVNVLPAISATPDAAANLVSLHAEHPRLNADNTRIEASLQGETLPVVPVDAHDWQIDLPELDEDLSVPLALTATITLDGETRTLQLPTLQLNTDADTGLGSASLDRQGLDTQALAASEQVPGEATPQSPSLLSELGGSVGQVLGELPEQAKALWAEVSPELREHSDDPLSWVLIAAVVVGLLMLIAWRRHAAHRRRRRREEPHV